MADFLSLVNNIFSKRYRDMGDGTHAEVVSVGGLNQPLTEAELAELVVAVDPVTATPEVFNVTLTVADTEYSQAMPANCRAFEFKCRTPFPVRYQYVTGKVATPTAPYATMEAGGSIDSPPINQGASPSTLYLASSEAGVVVEITAWV